MSTQTLSFLIFAEFPIFLIAVLYPFMPRLSRPGLWFGVTVDPSFRDSAEARATERGFRAQVLLCSALAAVLAGALVMAGRFALAPLAILLQIGGGTVAFVRARHRTRPFAAPMPTVREASLAPRSTALPGGFAAQAGPFLILAAAAVALAIRYPDLPEVIPIHFRLDGAPDGFRQKSIFHVFLPILIGAVLCLMQLGIAFAAMRTRAVEASGERGQAEQRFRSGMTGAVLLAAEYLVAVVMSFSALPLLGVSSRVLAATLPLTVVFLVILLVWTFRTGQGGSRLSQAPATPGDRTPDSAWKLGLIYFDQDNPSLIVERRFGVGYTINFGNRWAWVIAAGLVAFIALTLTLGIRSSS